ncbi:MAG: tripartite tricarboxylate transporter permease, partial [Angelakisella sp.]
AANNAVTAASFIPLLTLGIPGSVAAATMVGAFTMQGMIVGPTLFAQQSDILYAIMVGLIFVNLFMLLQGKYLIKFFSKLTKVPQTLLMSTLILFCIAGAFTFYNSIFDVYVFVACGIIMYLLSKFDVPGAPFVLGMILGPLAESNLKRSLVMSEGSWAIFFTRPLSLLFLVITVLFTFYSIKKTRELDKVAAMQFNNPQLTEED